MPSKIQRITLPLWFDDQAEIKPPCIPRSSQLAHREHHRYRKGGAQAAAELRDR